MELKNEGLIEIKDLTKDYGNERGIFDINLNINKGEMIGFVGTNGSGKTTTIRSILGFIKPTKGEVYVNGMESWKNQDKIAKLVGYVPGEIAFPDLKTGVNFCPERYRIAQNLHRSRYLFALRCDYRCTAVHF